MPCRAPGLFSAGMLSVFEGWCLGWRITFTLSPLISGYVPIMLPMQRSGGLSSLLRYERCHSQSH